TASDRLGEHVFENGLEREIDVVARDVELDRGDLARFCVGVDGVNELAKLVSRKTAERDNSVQPGRLGKIIAEVRLDADIAPAESIQPAGIHSSEGLRILAHELWQLGD